MLEMEETGEEFFVRKEDEDSGLFTVARILLVQKNAIVEADPETGVNVLQLEGSSLIKFQQLPSGEFLF